MEHQTGMNNKLVLLSKYSYYGAEVPNLIHQFQIRIRMTMEGAFPCVPINIPIGGKLSSCTSLGYRFTLIYRSVILNTWLKGKELVALESVTI